MKPARFAYVRPQTLEAAVAALAEHEDGQVLAGGQSLVPMLNMRLMRPSAVIDINRVRGLDGIAAGGGSVTIGALTRYSALEASPLVAERLPLLHEVVRHVGDRQVRNRGTIGGALVQADPVGEIALACLTLEATVVARSLNGARELAMRDFVLGPYTTALERNELLVEVRLPESPATCTFFELGRRHNDFAVLAVAIVGTRAGDRWSELRIGLAGVDDRPLLIDLEDSILDDRAIAAAVEACLAVSDPQSDVRASAEYRRHLVSVHVARQLRKLRDG